MSRRHAAAMTLALFGAAPAAPPSQRIAGVDEAGRGPLAGPVAVAAVVFDPLRPRINGWMIPNSSVPPAASSCTRASPSAHWPGTWCWWTLHASTS